MRIIACFANLFPVLGAAILGSALAVPPASAEELAPQRIIALGDLPYGNSEDVYPGYKALIDEINSLAPDLVIHVGDTKGGGACTDALLAEQLDFLNTFTSPTLYTPGDNEWTDCFRFSGGSDDPRERLQHIRRTYFDKPDQTFGTKKLTLTHQGAEGFPENARMELAGIGFITAHVVGSNNGLEASELAAAEEYFKRSNATARWLIEGFAAFDEAQVMVVAIHADMFEFDFNHYERERWLRHSGFQEFGMALQQAARDFGKPVLLIFGDSHLHRVFQPFPQYAPNVTAVEVYGYPDKHAVEITITPDAQMPFQIKPVWNPL